ncbi:Leucine-responsive regulatory protein [Austwickia sp. TVS 96-490-7B]|uniref:Lrp/AsnC family transcriptional regulator n=1 Tax=Austwickia sp. TVS 96-490-7B TaxID=2830843 RepID=UPI001C591615|nr:Lrp/AsnC family transcriptional regulator [Austwickia sp. TVS 96-490-7B]MBW3083967.1 Leucine-responsive regulatory protein [Austwickia sp. TVS 96-490-7B]
MPDRTSPTATALDATDRAIVAALVDDGRLSMRALAQRLHISRANAYARVERLTRSGVIAGFTARVVADRAGLSTAAYVSLSIEQDSWREVRDALVQVPYVEHVALVGAEFDVITLVRAPDTATLRDVVLERLQSIPGVKASRTWLVFADVETPGPWRSMEPTGTAD